MLNSKGLKTFHRTMMHCHAGVGLTGVGLFVFTDEPTFLVISCINLVFGLLSWHMSKPDK